MDILALDTSQAACSAALWRERAGERRVISRYEERSIGHAEALMPLVRDLLAEAGLAVADLDALAVTVGPGTFSGVRIALSAARGMALVAGLPVIGVTSLEAVAAGLDGAHEPEDAVRVACFDARRGEVYVQAFTLGLAPLTAPSLLKLADAAASLPGSELVLVGTGAGLLFETLKSHSPPGIETVRLGVAPPFPHAEKIAEIAARRMAEPGFKADTAPMPGPLYIRAPDAKLPTSRAPLS